MNAALKLCQAMYDAQLPPAVSKPDDQRAWLESAAEELVCGSAGAITAEELKHYSARLLKISRQRKELS